MVDLYGGRHRVKVRGSAPGGYGVRLGLAGWGLYNAETTEDGTSSRHDKCEPCQRRYEDVASAAWQSNPV